jgi:hypothetical protein
MDAIVSAILDLLILQEESGRSLPESRRRPRLLRRREPTILTTRSSSDPAVASIMLAVSY